jgi:hypothetical protein
MSAETDLIAPRRRPPPGELTYEEFLAWCDEASHDSSPALLWNKR